MPRGAGLPRGIPAASLKPCGVSLLPTLDLLSSAGNTRGLIEARPRSRLSMTRTCLPRGIPAASLKQRRFRRRGSSPSSSAGNTRGLIEATTSSRAFVSSPCLPRGIPAASLKPEEPLDATRPRDGSSAGNTRGLIEAVTRWGLQRCGSWSLPRGIPAASLKRRRVRTAARLTTPSSAGNTRGLIEARAEIRASVANAGVFRGEYPRPH